MKDWSQRFEEHISQWRLRLGTRGWWPRFLYHFTDVGNAASILRSGYLYSRSISQHRNLMLNDNANPEVILRTPYARDYVRLYFRPLTPTQYANEGIRPLLNRERAHCPVPVFLCFDALRVLSMDESLFADGNMSVHRVQFGRDQDLFDSIPFDLVFHHGRFQPEERDEIVFRRNAEVLIPNELPLQDNLKFIACRSAAERQMLLHLLLNDPPDTIRQAWANKIRVADDKMFYRKWTFVEEVVVAGNLVTFRFNTSSQTPGPFTLRAVYEPDGLMPRSEWQGVISRLSDSWSWQRPGLWFGEISLYLDDCLAFVDRVSSLEIPF